jgi:hypothetical protein
LDTVLWRDMLVAGTSLNILTALAGIVLFVAEVPVTIALTVYFGALPWNLFLFVAVWRSADHGDPSAGLIAKIVAAIWLGTVSVI